MVGAIEGNPIPFRVTNPERIPATRYYDGTFYQLECERLWPHVWQMACRLDQIPNVGDYIEYTNLGRSVVVVHTKSGVKAYHNTCRHRGVKLAEGHGNCSTTGLICPFHGWRWDMDGRNTFVYARHFFSDAQLDQADLALRPCRVELWGGCAFINFDHDAPGFRDSLGPLAERLEAYRIDKLKAEWWYATVLPANWKTAMEAFMEGTHVMKTHPQLQKAGPQIYKALYGPAGAVGAPVNLNASARQNIASHLEHMALLSDGMAGMCHAKDLAIAKALADVDLPDDPVEALTAWYTLLNAEVTRQGRERGEPTPDLNALGETHPLNGVEYLFPHYFMLPFLSSFSSYRVRPLGPESCLFEIWSLVFVPEGEEPRPILEPTMLKPEEFPPIPRQDFSNIPRQQLGLRGDGFEFMRLGKEVEGLISNYHRLIDGYLTGEPLQDLSKGMHCLAGGFDGPILDLKAGVPAKPRATQNAVSSSAKEELA